MLEVLALPLLPLEVMLLVLVVAGVVDALDPGVVVAIVADASLVDTIDSGIVVDDNNTSALMLLMSLILQVLLSEL